MSDIIKRALIHTYLEKSYQFIPIIKIYNLQLFIVV